MNVVILIPGIRRASRGPAIGAPDDVKLRVIEVGISGTDQGGGAGGNVAAARNVEIGSRALMQMSKNNVPLPLEPSRYDRIGLTYADYRRPDARIAAAIERALGDAVTVIDVGSGTGSYGPVGRSVLAIEPSLTMIRQRPPDAAPVVQAAAEHLPVRDGTFDAGLAVLTVHHWYDAA